MEPPVTDAQRAILQDRFLGEFAKCGVIRRAAAEAGCSRQVIYEWLKNPEFKARYETAESDALDVIREAIHDRGVEGWDEPVYQGGRYVGSVRKYSDSLLQFLARKRLPECRDKEAIEASEQPDANAPRKVEVTIREVSDWDSVTRVRG